MVNLFAILSYWGDRREGRSEELLKLVSCVNFKKLKGS